MTTNEVEIQWENPVRPIIGRRHWYYVSFSHETKIYTFGAPLTNIAVLKVPAEMPSSEVEEHQRTIELLAELRFPSTEE